MNYLIRIELHSAVWPDDYNTLHAAMTQLGFEHVIKADDDKLYRLPTAEYTAQTGQSIELVRQYAKQAADATGRLSTVLVVSYTAWAGVGMEAIQAAA